MATVASLQRIQLNKFKQYDSRRERLERLTARAARSNENNENSNEKENESSSGGTDWDRAWTSYRKEKRTKPLFDLNMEQHVTRQPTYRDYPLSEEVDQQFRKVERSSLEVWTNPKFTYAGFSVIFGMFVYMIINSPHA